MEPTYIDYANVYGTYLPFCAVYNQKKIPIPDYAYTVPIHINDLKYNHICIVYVYGIPKHIYFTSQLVKHWHPIYKDKL